MLDNNIINYLKKDTQNLDSMTNLYHYTIPNFKMYYPEPFIASATFLHYDMWFIHISIYQYWLWFFFVFIIIFFTLSFLTTLRWCNIRVRPQRETRGVSRSKCGDLVTATVPVSWASCIIIHESTDAIEYYEGFGTTEMAVGVRAYQWGWEYYYPKDIDLNYSTKNNNSFEVGKSLSENYASDDYSESSVFWNYYKSKDFFDGVVTPINLITSSVDSKDTLSIWKFKNFGFPKSVIRGAFKNVTNTRYKTFDNFDNNFYKTKATTSSFFRKINVDVSNLSSPTISENQVNYLNTFALPSYSKKTHNLNNLNTFISNNLEGYGSDKINLNLLEKNNKFSNENYTNLLTYLDTSKFDNLKKEETSSKNINMDGNFLFHEDFFTKGVSVRDEFNLNLKTPFNKVFSKKNKTNDDFLYTNTSYSKSPNQPELETLINPIRSLNDSNNAEFGDSGVVNNVEDNFYRWGKLNNNKTINYIGSIDRDWINEGGEYSNANHSAKQPNQNLFKSNLASSLNKENSYSKDIDNTDKVSNVLSAEFEVNKEYIDNNYNKNKVEFNKNSYRLGSIYENNKKIMENKWPKFYVYADVDFKRASMNEILEDVFWENQIQDSVLEDMSVNKSKNIQNSNWFKEVESFYNREGLSFKDVSSVNQKNKGSINYLNIFTKDSTKLDYSKISKNDYNLIANEEKYNEYLENSFDVNKNSELILDSVNLNYVYSNNLFKMTTSNLLTSNMFWSEIENFNYLSVNKEPAFEDISFSKGINLNLNQIQPFSNKDVNSVTRFPTNYSILDATKGLINIDKAIWKVYRGYFDEGRSSSVLKDLSTTKNEIPIIARKSAKNLYKPLLNKNNNTNVKGVFYKKTLERSNSFIPNTSKFFLYEFPFFTALENDSIRYTWFDWYSKAGKRVAKSLDTSDYNLHGSRTYKKNYSYSNSNYVDANTLENYLTRVTHARKLYVSSWALTLFNSNKIKSWFNENQNGVTFGDSLSKLAFVNDSIELANVEANLLGSKNSTFVPANSNNYVPTRNYWKSTNSYGSYNYYHSLLLDILTKREYMVRQMYKNSLKFIDLPESYLVKPSNPILLDLKTSIVNKSEVEVYSENQKLLKLKNISKDYFGKDDLSLYKKSQYKHMRKNVSNMIRIQADKAVAMPIDTRIQILTLSKDIIHSWAIPSAGIKIDCIPGYSSHKVTIFLLSGVYWGQCMEICGRFHHWMPIVVYFMKRDLFILWCTHFVLKNKSMGKLDQGSDKNNIDFLPVVSFENNKWS